MKKLLLVGLLLASASGIWAQTGQNAKQSEKTEPATEAMSAMSLASNLVKYGTKHNQALPLIQAMQIVKDYPMVQGEQAKEGDEAGTQAKENTITLNYADIMARAKALAGSDNSMLALIDQVDKQKSTATRGRTTGSTYHEDVVRSNKTDIYSIRFVGGEVARVAVIGDGDTDLDLYVYDENNNLIVSDTDYTDDCYVSWTPRWTGTFKVHIKNRGNVYNRYTLITN